MIKLIGKKRFLSLLLSMLLLLTLIPATAITAFAEETEGVLDGVFEGFEFSWSAPNGDAVFEDGAVTITAVPNENSCVQVTTTTLTIKNLSDTDKYLSFNYDVSEPEGSSETMSGALYLNGNSDESYKGKGELTVKIDANGSAKVSLTSGSAESFSAKLSDFALAGDVYTLTGDTDFLDGWKPEIDKNVMTKDEDGNYSITIYDVPAKENENYTCKVVRFIGGSSTDIEWIGIDGTYLNRDFAVTDICDVTITFNPTTKEIIATGDYVTAPYYKIDYITAVGSGKNGFLNDLSWDPNADENKMTEVSEGIYEISYENVKPDEEYQVKFAVNGNWSMNWGAYNDAEFNSGKETPAKYNGGNILFTPVTDEEFVTVTVRLDITKWDSTKKTGATYTITAGDSKPEPTEAETEAPTEPEPTEPQTVEPQPTEPEPTEPQTTEPKPTEAAPTDPEPTEAPTVAPAQPEVEREMFYFLPDKGQVSDGNVVKLVLTDKNGTEKTYTMKATPFSYDGVAVYCASIPEDINPETVKISVFNGVNITSEVTLTAEQYNAVKGKVVTSNGTAYSEKQAESKPVVKTKKANPLTVTAKTKTVKAKKLKAKKQKVKALTFKNAQGAVTVTLVKKGTTKKILKKLKVSKKGVITFKKGKYAKKTYKIKLKITAKGNTNYNPKTLTKIVKIRVK